ncbi:MAG TPA: glycosyltransferase family 4 protein [Rhizomicrobium sp.]
MTRALHILHIFPGFRIGGAQMRFVELAKGFGDAFTHTIIALDGSYTAARFLPPGLPITLGEDAPDKSGSLPARLRRYRKEIAAKAPDLLVTYNWGSIEWAMANFIGGVPHIHIEDGFGPEEAVRQFRRRVLTRRLTLSRSQVIVPSLTLRDLALRVWRLNSQNLHYIPNGIPSHEPAPVPPGLADIPHDKPRIVWAGAVRREKNLPRLLDAFAPLRDQAVLIVAGDGSELDAARRQAEALSLNGSVFFLGRREDVRDIIPQCDLMALSSDTEQMPLVVLEAMAAGLPIAGTRVGDVANMVAEENRPAIVNISDTALSEAMRSLVADAAARQAIGAANRQRWLQDYQAESMIAAYAALFRQTAARKARRP